MTRALRTVLSLVLLAACTTRESPSSEPIVTRRFVGYCPADEANNMEASRALERHGISCHGFSGSIKESNRGPIYGWRTRCSGTEQEWSQAESTIARLTADGVMEEVIDRYFVMTEHTGVDSTAFVTVLGSHGVSCGLERDPAGSQLWCAGTEQDWRQAKSSIAQLTADGIVKETSPE
jgi:hypothetical protein